jgi:hypothetical protein
MVMGYGKCGRKGVKILEERGKGGQIWWVQDVGSGYRRKLWHCKPF